MFRQLRNIETAFRHVRTFSLLFLVACTVVSIYAIFKAYRMVSEERERIYILSNGKALEAFSEGRTENLPVELRNHIGNFHRHFFSLDPDEKVIQANMAKAFDLADISAKREHDNLREQGFYANIISANISTRIEIDSISLLTDRTPYRFTCYATQTIIRSTSTVRRNLITKGEIRNVNRSDNNPHGFLIQRWETVMNENK
ncbi:conjugative transposon protein TraK [Sphingobacterium psychroaquaticum]|uniref:Bacteroides conjugative transposon TraK protein n=1 Tax=Sphingobacterium psychroaquaticum TaxID=561061 RepID=A0A1X7IM54_9SPHI|nr:conjugative transposon protein TraK [Sphingobacterium psychroaquaticum]SMG15665.1 Bacteroides conjugative transposon TraK protein [Sphingobacterium psychroaquaticum]